ncbi:pyridoxamine 5'-phosphate oxidase family protein [Micromonospora sp. WMMD1274]|uniref:pyridoxamine 5'-phosphate oxidase family protein n=1 Tax=Micromonospora sp. WMMD1274 TaxID=3404116 RepID=UPI003B952195
MDDRRILQELSRHEALRLLAGVAMGRVVFTQRALPAIRPVNHLLDQGGVIIRTNLASSVTDTVIRRPDIAVA